MAKAQKPWYQIKAQATPGRAEIYIYDVIVDYAWSDDETTAKGFIADLRALGDIAAIDLHINSPGGSVFAGNAIYNALRRHPATVTVHVDGLAASIASVIAMAGDTVVMPENAMLMIHDPWSYAVGNATEMRKMAESLDKAKVGLVSAYRDKSGMADEKISSLMSAETWITASEAVGLGLADHIEEPVSMAARFDLSRYRKVPQALASIQNSKGAKPMNIENLKQDHPDLLNQIEAEARQGMIAQADHETALAVARGEAATAARQPVLDLAAAVFGAELGGKFAAAVEAGLTAETASALGVSFAPQAAAGNPAVLEALQAAAPEAVSGAKPAAAGEAEARQAAVSVIASGGSVQ